MSQRQKKRKRKKPRKSYKNLKATPRSSWCVRSRPWWLWVCSPGVNMCNISWLSASSMVIPCPCVHPQAHYVRWGCQDVDRRRKCVASGWKSKYLGETLPAQFLGTGLFGFAFQEPKNQGRGGHMAIQSIHVGVTFSMSKIWSCQEALWFSWNSKSLGWCLTVFSTKTSRKTNCF